MAVGFGAAHSVLIEGQDRVIIVDTMEEIEALKPGPQETPQVSRLRNGHQVELSENKISELLPQAVKFMKAEMGFKAEGVLYTRKFPAKKCSCPTIFLFDCTKFIIGEILTLNKLGVVVPLDS